MIRDAAGVTAPPLPHDSSAGALDKARLVGRGFTSDVYAWGEGRVLKLFHRGRDPSAVEREFRVTQAVHALGVPAPAVYEMIQLEGRWGIVFERVEGVSLFKQVQARPWTLFAATRELAQLHAKLHDCQAPGDLPAQKEWIAGRIGAAPNLAEEEREEARRALERLPEGNTLCHGDFHPENVLCTPRGPVIIDWSRATRGDPLGDVACTSRLLQIASLPDWAPFYTHWLLRLFRLRLHQTYLSSYLRHRPGSRREIQAWEEPLAVAARGWPNALPEIVDIPRHEG